MINLCVHENMRVYYDRLSCFENKKMMKEEVQKNMRKMITQCTPCTPSYFPLPHLNIYSHLWHGYF
jgi:hypothetical protein